MWVKCALAVALAGAPSPSEEPPELPPDAEAEPSSRDAKLAEAEAAWNEGNWVHAREILEPIAANEELSDPIERERILLTLADATVQDSTLPEEDRQVRAGEHLDALMDANPEWKLKKNVYSPELYALWLDKRQERQDQAGSKCRAALNACVADIDAADAKLDAKQEEYDALKKAYDEEDVYVGVQRSRALALFPLGISHFLNGGGVPNRDASRRVKWDRALGAIFLITETGFGLAGLGLLIHRNTALGCNRERRFQRGSLVCDPRIAATEGDVVQRRKIEEGMGWAFLGAIAVDILLAQIRFDAFRLEYKQSRKELEEEQEAGRSRRRRRRRNPKPRAKVRPSPAFIPAGAGAGLDIRF